MRTATALATGVVAATALLSGGPADAGAWTQAKGKTQIIVKAEAMTAEDAFDPDGVRVPLSVERRDRSVGVFAEYGLTDRLTVQVKGDWQDGEDQFVAYQGRGPIEVALVWQVWRDERTAFSVQGGFASAGDGRNAGYAAPGVGDNDWEARASLGRSFGGLGGGALRSDRTFVEVQAARRFRDGLPDEVRIDATVGAHFGDRWLVLGQAYGGQAREDHENDDGARWLSLETSVVRHLGAWSVQAGWRETVAGRETPLAKGAVLAVWRRF
ncbi:hypothetical protein BH10PSE1_BH10PSE1_04480 [soil metagenome]